MLQAMKIPAAKAAVDKEWENMEKIRSGTLTKVWSKKEVIDEARTKGAKVHLMDICHLKNAALVAKHQKYKGRVLLRGDTVKDDSGSYAVFTEQGSSASQMTAAKVMDYPIQPARVLRTSIGCSTCLYPGKNEDAPQLLKIPKSECPDIWICRPRHKWPKSWSEYGRPSRSSWAKSVWSSFGRTVMGKAIRESSIEVRLGERFQLGMLIRTPWKRVILTCVCGWH